MRHFTAICLGLMLVLAGVPLLLGGGGPGSARDERRLIIVTPHVQQIRVEFGRAFAAWHAAKYPGEAPVRVEFRSPGGTSEIIRLLQAQYNAAIAAGRIAPDGSCEPGVIGYDMMFGGGTFDHGRLASGEGVRVTPPGATEAVNLPMSVSAGFSSEQMSAWFSVGGQPVDKVGTQPLYDPEQRWIGTALSSFGVVYNRRLVYELLGKENIESFDDLTDPRLRGWVAFADPRQSGSISTTLDAVLSKYGWDDGWRLLRRMSANARTFVASSARPPLDVSQGEAAVALAIDFYGRAQGQSILEAGQSPEDGRVGYLDPPGAVYIDPDPLSILRGGPEPVLARRFIEFVLSREGQALWNYRSRRTLEADPALPRPPATEDGRPVGPAEYELRRLPILPSIYAEDSVDRAFMVDQVNPYAIATEAAPRGWRSAIGPIMGAFAIDSAPQCRAAWDAINRVKADPAAPASLLHAMEASFDAMPTGAQVRSVYERTFGIPRPAAGAEWPVGPDGAALPLAQAYPDLAPWDAFQDFTPDNFRAIRGTWRTPRWASRLKVVYTQVFRENYAEVVDLEARWRRGDGGPDTPPPAIEPSAEPPSDR